MNAMAAMLVKASRCRTLRFFHIVIPGVAGDLLFFPPLKGKSRSLTRPKGERVRDDTRICFYLAWGT
jgi:hypothetical protein